MYFEFTNKTKVCAGKNALDHLEYECLQYHIHKPLILTDDVLFDLKYVDYVLSHLSLEYALFTHIPVDSSIHVVEEIRALYLKERCDGIIALGGGSVLDTAKGVYLMLSQDTKKFEDIMGYEDIKKGKDIPFFTIPTTSGTGSEATCVAVISHPEKQIKMEIISQQIQSDITFLDPFFTLNLPLKTTVSTGIDALVHAIEAYTCSQKNPISDAYAITTIRSISKNIKEVIKKPQNEDIRMNLALASYCGGVAFSNSMVGIIHAIGHALGAVCHVPHGDAMTMLLVPCMKFNLDVNEELYADLLLYLGDTDLYASTSKKKLAITTINQISKLLKTLHKDANLPISLESIEGLKDHLDEVAERALNDGALIVNNKHATKKDILDILEGKYGY